MFLLMSFGVAVWAKGGFYKVIGILMVVVGAALYVYFLSIVYFVMALALGVILGGFRRH